MMDAKLLVRNLLDVFNERDAATRLQVIQELYTEDGLFHEAEESFQGAMAINTRVSAVLEAIPPEFRFRPTGAQSENHDAARLAWTLGPEDGPAVAHGQDVALLKDGRDRRALCVYRRRVSVV